MTEGNVQKGGQTKVCLHLKLRQSCSRIAALMSHQKTRTGCALGNGLRGIISSRFAVR